MANNIISFSIWGNDPRFLIGAKRNIEEAQIVYPDWKCRFYIDDTVPLDNAKEWHDMGAEVYKVQRLGLYHGMFWRFFPASDETVDAFISRDTDSRVNEREAEAVKEWLDSKYGFHIIRDHLHHSQFILGGLWGAKKGTIPDMVDRINKWGNFSCKGIDQGFLGHEIYPLIKDNYLAHDDMNDSRTNKLDNAKPFPSHPPLRIHPYCYITKQTDFCGSIFNSDDTPGHWRPY